MPRSIRTATNVTGQRLVLVAGSEKSLDVEVYTASSQSLDEVVDPTGRDDREPEPALRT